MADDDWRRAERSSDIEELRRALPRMPLEFLVGLRQRLLDAQQLAAERLAALDVEAPRCRCGAVSEGLCDQCREAMRKADDVLAYWRGNGAYVRWLAGEQFMVKDAEAFIETWLRAHWATRPSRWDASCAFPGCPGHGYFYCQNHRWLKTHGFYKDLSKARGAR